MTIGTPISKSLFLYKLQIIVVFKKSSIFKNKKRLSTMSQKNKKRLYKIAKSETRPFFTAFLMCGTACTGEEGMPHFIMNRILLQ